ncbi:11441_t:CDS:2 [Funneliformis geosporum]|nr:11441_t:CDS:2 [Funneliformis geosporum]
MDYCESGDLRNYITKNFYSNWDVKLNILNDIINGLVYIHGQNIIHRDFHSGNILFSVFYTVISDLGISKSLIESIDNDEEIYDIVPYVALEILQRQKYITASDIYSFGMIMWELMTGRRLFWDQSHDTDLIINICDGLRPSIVTNAPDGYIGLMQQCWHSEPNLRPSATEIYNNVLKRIISNESKSKRMFKGNLDENHKTDKKNKLSENNNIGK